MSSSLSKVTFSVGLCLIASTLLLIVNANAEKDKQREKGTEKKSPLGPLMSQQDVNGARLLNKAFTGLLELNGYQTMVPPSKQSKDKKISLLNLDPTGNGGKKKSTENADKTASGKTKKKKKKKVSDEKSSVKESKEDKKSSPSAKKSKRETNSAKNEPNPREEYVRKRKEELAKEMEKRKEYAPNAADTAQVAKLKSDLRECTGSERYLKEEHKDRTKEVSRLTMDIHALDKMYKNEEAGKKDCLKREKEVRKQLADLQATLKEVEALKNQPRCQEKDCEEMYAKLKQQVKSHLDNINEQTVVAKCKKEAQDLSEKLKQTTEHVANLNEHHQQLKKLAVSHFESNVTKYYNETIELNAKVDELRVELNKCLTSLEQGNCWDNKEDQINYLVGEVERLKKENKELNKKLLSQSNTSDGVSSSSKDEDIGQSTDSSTKENDVKVTELSQARDSKRLWQSYKEVLLLLEATRLERDEQKKKFDECAAGRELTEHSRNLANATKELEECSVKLGGCRVFRDREDDLVKPRPPHEFTSVGECNAHLKSCEKAVYTFRDAFDRGVDKWYEMRDQLKELQKQCHSNTTEALNECRWSMARIALEKSGANEEMTRCAEEHLKCRRTKQSIKNKLVSSQLLAATCQDEEAILELKLASAIGARDKCLVELDNTRHHLILRHNHGENLKRSSADKLSRFDEYSSIINDIGAESEVYRKVYFKQVLLTETIKSERDSNDVRANLCEERLEGCMRQAENAEHHSGASSEGYCTRPENDEERLLKQELKALKRLLATTRSELAAYKNNYFSVGGKPEPKSATPFSVSHNDENNRHQPAEHDKVLTELNSCQHHLSLQHDHYERLKRSSVEKLSRFNNFTTYLNELGRESELYQEVYYKRVLLAQTIKAERDSHEIRANLCETRLEKLKQQMEDEQHHSGGESEGYCTKPESDNEKLLKQEVTSLKRLLAATQQELTAHRNNYFGGVKPRVKSATTFSVDTKREEKQGQQTKDNVEDSSWLPADEEAADKLLNENRELKRLLYECLGKQETSEHHLRASYELNERLKRSSVNKLSQIDKWVKSINELGSERNAYKNGYYKQVRLTETIKSQRDNYDRASVACEKRLKKLKDKIAKEKHEGDGEGAESGFCSRRDEDEEKLLNEEIKFLKRSLATMEAELASHRHNYATGPNLGARDIKTFSVESSKKTEKDDKKDAMPTRAEEVAELKAALTTLEDERNNCMETVQVLRKRAEQAEANHVTVSNELKTLTANCSKCNSTLNECEQEQARLRFTNAGIDMILTQLEDEKKREKQVLDAKLSIATRDEAYFRQMFLITLLTLMALASYDFCTWLAKRLGYDIAIKSKQAKISNPINNDKGSSLTKKVIRKKD